MGVAQPGKLSLGEFSAITRYWAKSHGQTTTAAPSDDEFDRAVMAARGLT